MINGAIAAGKDTVSVALAGLLEKDGRRVAVVGLDELWAMIDHQQPRQGDLASWLLARRGAAALADLFYSCGRDDVIVNGPFFSSAERSGFLDHLATPVVPRFFTLRVSFEESFRRVREDDHPRGVSRDRTFLAERFAVSEALLQAVASTDLVIDTDRRSPTDVAREIHSALSRDLTHPTATLDSAPPLTPLPRPEGHGSKLAVVVRRAVAADLSRSLPLLEAMGKTTHVAELAARFSALVDVDDHLIAVASTADALVGYAWAQDRGPHLRSGSRTVRLHDLFVRPSDRRHGVGRSLFDSAREWARARGARWMEWQASAAALGFYERLGLIGEACPDPEHPFFEIDFQRP